MLPGIPGGIKPEHVAFIPDAILNPAPSFSDDLHLDFNFDVRYVINNRFCCRGKNLMLFQVSPWYRNFFFLPRTHTDGQRHIISKRKYINVCVGLWLI